MFGTYALPWMPSGRVTRAVSIGLALVLLVSLGAPAWAQPAGEKAPEAGRKAPTADTDKLLGLQIRQETRGIPGRVGGDQQRVAQVIRVTSDRLRLDDRDTGSILLLRLDGDTPRFFEVSPDEKQYRQGKDLDKIQHDRNRVEQQMIEAILSDDAKKQEQALGASYLRRDGARVVTVEEKPDAEKVLGHTCKRYVLKENGRRVVDVHVTEDFGVQIPFFDYYRRVGAFSDEVLTELKKIQGVPLRADFTVVTAGLNYDLSVVATAAKKASFDREIFELPEGAKEVVESTIAPCAECSKDVEIASPGGKAVINGEPVYFCCKECRKAFFKRRYGK